MSANMSRNARCRNVELQNKFWHTGVAPDRKTFEEHMKDIEINYPHGFKWIKEQEDVSYWALSHDFGRRFGIMTTNLSESFNNVLKRVRGLPLCPLIMMTYLRLNKYFVSRRDEGENMILAYPKKINDEITNQRQMATQLCVTRHSHNLFSVESNQSRSFQVTLTESGPTCSCGYIDAHHIPCSHVLAVCSNRHANIHTSRIVSEYLTTQAYRKAYAPIFFPILDERFWIEE